MRFVGRVIGLLLIGLFVLVLPLAIWTFNLQRILLDSATYQRVFDDEDFYADIAPGVLPALLTGLEIPDPDPGQIAFLDLIDTLDQDAWRDIAPQFVPPSWVEQETRRNLDSFLAWLDSDAPLNLAFNTGDIKRQLESTNGGAAVARMLGALPVCSPPQERAMQQFFDQAPDVAFPYCRPTDEDLRRQLGQVVNDARLQAARYLPERLDVIDEMSKAAESEAATHAGLELEGDPFSDVELNGFRAGVRLWRGLLPLTLLVPLEVIALMVIVAIRSSKMFFRWTGWALMLGSLIALAPLYLLPFIVSDMSYESDLTAGFATGGALIAELAGHRMLRVMISAFTWPVLFQSGVMLVIGFVFVVLSVLLRDPERPLAAQPGFVPQPTPNTPTPGTMPPMQTPSGYHVYQPPPGRSTTTGTSTPGEPPPGSP